MKAFASAAPSLGGELGWPALPWLAGLLEGEGSFLRPCPSAPRSPAISCRMTDLDVIELVAALFGTSVQANDKGRHKTEYATAIRGSRCAELMRTLRPMMGARRQRAIDRALEGYHPPIFKLNHEIAEEIRARLDGGEPVSSLAAKHRVSERTIREIRTYGHYAMPDRFPWIPISWVIRGATSAGTGLTWAELYWLAGWLEAEGSFLRPPPSSPKQARISGSGTDQDVLHEVGRLIRARPRIDRAQGRRQPDWSPLWRVLINGGRAVVLMQAIQPVMGSRRTTQIERALDAAETAGAVLGWHDNASHRPTPDSALLET